MTEKSAPEHFAEDVSASLSRCLEEMDQNIDKATRSTNVANGSRSRSSHSAPSADNMAEALESPINEVLGKADGGFLAGLLDGQGTDDPATRDYGDRYQYLDLIGEGGQGKVLRFRDTVLDRDVAIKVVKPPHTSDREKLLENEARLGGMLEHPNILPTYDLCRDETGSPFFVMKKVEGFSFDELLKKAHAEGDIHSHRDRGEYSRRRLLNIFLQVCHAIEYAHSRGVCHLDLKPQNVKLGPFGEVYVLDWGFASRLEDNPKMVAGTPLYIAPERFRPGKPDQRCDVYSLGVMLYRILVNQLPRDVGKTSFKEFRKRIHDFPIIPPRQRDPSLPRDLEAVIMKALAENPDDRYQTVRELAGDLERFLDILPVSAYREGLWGRARKFARRHRTTVLAAAVMFAALVLTAGASIRARALAAQTEAAELLAKTAELEAQLDRERADKALAQMREAEEERRQAIERQQQAEAERLEDEKRRLELTRRRAAARVPLEKGLDIMDKSKVAIARERDKAKKLQLLQPAIDLFGQSIGILEQKDEKSLDAANAYYARARAYELGLDPLKAEKDYQAAYKRDPSFIMAHYYRGMINFEVHHKEKEAMEEFAAMNKIDPGNEFSEIGQAYLDMTLGRNAEALKRVDAIETKERAARGESDTDSSWRNPGLSMVWYIRGMIYGNKDGAFYNANKSLEAYTNYLQYATDKPSAYSNRGIAHEQLYLQLRSSDREAAEKHLDMALADYARALEVDPTYKPALQHRGYALFKYKKDSAAAMKEIEAALKLDPKYVAVLLDRGAIREDEGKYDLALQDYEQVRKIAPDNQNIDYRIGVLHLYTGELEKAEKELSLSVAKVNDSAAKGIRLYRLGIARFLLGDYMGAVESFNQSLSERKTGQIYPALMRWLSLSKMGITPKHEGFAKMLSDIGPDKPHLAVVASIFLGDDPFGEDQALRLAGTPEALCETAFYLGARAWALGKNEDALYLLGKAVETKVSLFMEYSMAKILSERIRKQVENARVLPDRVGGPEPVPLPDTLGLPPSFPSLEDLIDTGGERTR